MENPILSLLSILNEYVAIEDDIDLDEFDDGEKHTVSEAREVFNNKVDECIERLEETIDDLKTLKSELAGTSVKAFIKRH